MRRLTALLLASLVVPGCRGESGDRRLLEPLPLSPAFPLGGAPCPDRVPVQTLVPVSACPPPGVGSAAYREILGEAPRIGGSPRRGWTPQLVDLVWADPWGIPMDRSVQQLEAEAVEGQSGTAWGVLAGGLLLRAERRQDPMDLLKAMEAASRGVALDPDDPVATFNLALATERLALVDMAAQHWRDAVGDPEDPRTPEARRRAERAFESTAGPSDADIDARGLVERSPYEARVRVRNEVLPAWGDAVTANRDEEAAQLLSRADSVATLLFEIAGDASATAATDRVLQTPPRQRGVLARGYAAYGRGLRHYDAAEFAQAREAFLEASKELGRGASEPWLEYFLVVSDYHANAGDSATAEGFRRVGRMALESGLPSLHAQAIWGLGTLALRAGLSGEAEDLYGNARARFAELGEQEMVGALDYLLFDALQDTRPVPEVVEALQRALHSTRGSRDVWRHNLLLVGAEFALRLDLPSVASVLHDEDVRVTASLPPARALEARLARARFLAGGTDPQQAEDDLLQALRLEDQVEDPFTRTWFAADRALVEARLLLGEDPGTAVVRAGQAAAHFEGVPSLVRVVPALAVQARALLADGRGEEARNVLDRALAMVLRRADGERLPLLRAVLLDAGGDLFELAATVRLQDGDIPGAMAVLEAGRTRPARGSGPTSLEATGEAFRTFLEGAHRLDHDILRFAFLNDGLYSWHIGPGGLSATAHSVEASALAQAVDRVRRALDRNLPEDAQSAALADLYSLLVEPIQGFDPGADRPLVVVPDGILHGVPWGALVLPGGSYLVERRPVGVAESVLPPANPGRAQGAIPPSPRALLLGDLPPGVDRPPRFAPLPASNRELDGIEPLYPGAERWRAEASTVASWVESARGADILHYAGHAVLDPVNPGRSHLLLPFSDPLDPQRRPVRWSTDEIAREDLGRLRLVVLSACSTLDGPSGRSSPLVSLAGAFIAAGVQGVVGTLWPIADDSAAEFSLRLHQHLASGRSPLEAVRATQLSMIRSTRTEHRLPSRWAAFVHIGS